MKILITGVTGFIGGHLAPALKREGHRLEAFVRPTSVAPISPAMDHTHRVSLTDVETLRAAMDDLKPDILIHLAALTLPGRNLADFEDQYLHTVRPALTMARLIPPSVRLALFFGSCEEYGDQTPPFTESLPPRCFSPYGWGKISAFHGVTEILSQRQIRGCWVRPFLTFGPGPMHSQLIPSVIQGCLRGETIPLTHGAQSRDFLFVEDLCDMVTRMIASPELAAGQTLNLASGVPRTIRSVAESIQQTIGRGNLVFGALPYRTQEAMSFFGSTARFESLFGPVPQTPFTQAIAKTIEAYR